MGPIHASFTKRFIPLAMNHFGLRGGHFNSTLKEFETILVNRPSGCSMMRGPFALSMNGAMGKILHTWGSTLTWTTQRQHAVHILSGMYSFFASSAFLQCFTQDSPAAGLLHMPPPPPPVPIMMQQPPYHALEAFDGGHGTCMTADWHRTFVPAPNQSYLQGNRVWEGTRARVSFALGADGLTPG